VQFKLWEKSRVKKSPNPYLTGFLVASALASSQDLGEALLDFTSKADFEAWLGDREASSD
jgi:hypothetical protein